MATIGLAYPYAAKYTVENGEVKYTNPMVFAKAVNFSSNVNSASDNNFYADNGIAETDKQFSDGTLTVTTDDLMQDASAFILGITPKTMNVGDKEVTELVYDDDAISPDLGFGVVIMKKKNGAIKHRAVVYTKINFTIPQDAANTKAGTVEWQTPSLTATIMRDDTEKHAWKREATFDTESEARAYIEAILGTPEAV